MQPERYVKGFLDGLLGRPEREWLGMGGYSNRRRLEHEALVRTGQEARGAALSSPKSREFLFLLSEQTLVNPQQLEELAKGFEDWNAIYNVVRAGWAQSFSGGILVTDQGRAVIGMISGSQTEASISPERK